MGKMQYVFNKKNDTLSFVQSPVSEKDYVPISGPGTIFFLGSGLIGVGRLV